MLRRLFATAVAVIRGVAQALFGRHEPMIELAPGDRAPDFALAGSDGRVHRLSDHAGRSAVVLAWFPKAFTGG